MKIVKKTLLFLKDKLEIKVYEMISTSKESSKSPEFILSYDSKLYINSPVRWLNNKEENNFKYNFMYGVPIDFKINNHENNEIQCFLGIWSIINFFNNSYIPMIEDLLFLLSSTKDKPQNSVKDFSIYNEIRSSYIFLNIIYQTVIFNTASIEDSSDINVLLLSYPNRYINMSLSRFFEVLLLSNTFFNNKFDKLQPFEKLIVYTPDVDKEISYFKKLLSINNDSSNDGESLLTEDGKLIELIQIPLINILRFISFYQSLNIIKSKNPLINDIDYKEETKLYNNMIEDLGNIIDKEHILISDNYNIKKDIETNMNMNGIITFLKHFYDTIKDFYMVLNANTYIDNTNSNTYPMFLAIPKTLSSLMYLNKELL